MHPRSILLDNSMEPVGSPDCYNLTPWTRFCLPEPPGIHNCFRRFSSPTKTQTIESTLRYDLNPAADIQAAGFSGQVKSERSTGAVEELRSPALTFGCVTPKPFSLRASPRTLAFSSTVFGIPLKSTRYTFIRPQSSLRLQHVVSQPASPPARHYGTSN